MRRISLGASIAAVLVSWFVILSQMNEIIDIFNTYSIKEIVILLFISGFLAILWVFELKEIMG